MNHNLYTCCFLNNYLFSFFTLSQKTNKIRAEKRMLEEEKKELQRELANLKLAFANHKCKRHTTVHNDESEFMNLLIQLNPHAFQSTSLGKHIGKNIPQRHLN